MNVDDSVISRQPSVSSNDNKHATAAEDTSEDSDQNINSPISPGSLKNNNDAVSVINASNFNFSDESSAWLANTNQIYYFLL